MAKEWHERSRLSWCKLWMRWYTSPSHRHLNAATHGVGLALLCLANEQGRCSDGSGWALDAEGRPVSERFLAGFCNASHAEVRRAIQSLRAVGTIVERPSDGALGFPKLKHFQEDPSTERKRRAKARRENLTVVEGGKSA